MFLSFQEEKKDPQSIFQCSPQCPAFPLGGKKWFWRGDRNFFLRFVSGPSYLCPYNLCRPSENLWCAQQLPTPSLASRSRWLSGFMLFALSFDALGVFLKHSANVLMILCLTLSLKVCRKLWICLVCCKAWSSVWDTCHVVPCWWVNWNLAQCFFNSGWPDKLFLWAFSVFNLALVKKSSCFSYQNGLPRVCVCHTVLNVVLISVLSQPSVPGAVWILL